jgi:hypothetical protein
MPLVGVRLLHAPGLRQSLRTELICSASEAEINGDDLLGNQAANAHIVHQCVYCLCVAGLQIGAKARRAKLAKTANSFANRTGKSRASTATTSATVLASNPEMPGNKGETWRV